ncbi:hypothetical protein KX729_08600 [Rhizobium sp. XQZ8]|nr:hypothetical protein [Rhizobium populisoli]MBW6421499.1 hypothetical protein [Rhizobium populisoli]
MRMIVVAAVFNVILLIGFIALALPIGVTSQACGPVVADKAGYCHH